MIVLSLCDGISCGQLALERAGIVPSKYLASEIDKDAIRCTQHWFPDTVQLGDMRDIDEFSLSFEGVDKIDLLLCGSPCQGFSYAGKRLNFSDPRSSLFFEFVRILRELKPKWFLFENVRMKWEWEDIITQLLNTSKKTVSSARVCAQDRVRNYWCNWHWNEPLVDSEIEVKHILEHKISNPIPTRLVNRTYNNCRERADGEPLFERLEVSPGKKKSHTVTATFEFRVGVSSEENNLGSTAKFYEEKGLWYRPYTVLERERLQTLPDSYTAMLADASRYNAIGNGWTVGMIAHILKQNKELL